MISITNELVWRFSGFTSHTLHWNTLLLSNFCNWWGRNEANYRLLQKERWGKIIRWFNIGWKCYPCEPNLSRLLQAKQWLFLIYTNDVNSVSFWIGSLTWSFNFFKQQIASNRMHMRRTQSCFIVTAEGLLDVTKTFASLQGFDKGESSWFRSSSDFSWLLAVQRSESMSMTENSGSTHAFLYLFNHMKEWLMSSCGRCIKESYNLAEVAQQSSECEQELSLTGSNSYHVLGERDSFIERRSPSPSQYQSPSPSPSLGKGLILADQPMSNLKHICVIEKESCPSLQPA